MNLVPQRITTGHDDMPRWSPDGTQIVFVRDVDGVFQLYKVRADGSAEVKLSTSLKSDLWPSWSPN